MLLLHDVNWACFINSIEIYEISEDPLSVTLDSDRYDIIASLRSYPHPKILFQILTDRGNEVFSMNIRYLDRMRLDENPGRWMTSGLWYTITKEQVKELLVLIAFDSL